MREQRLTSRQLLNGIRTGLEFTSCGAGRDTPVTTFGGPRPTSRQRSRGVKMTLKFTSAAEWRDTNSATMAGRRRIWGQR
jgi:hypothetical protein